MSWFDYQESKRLAADDAPFHALLMAAMRKADSTNLDRLRAAFPGIYAELLARYEAPGGALPSDPELLADGR